MGFLSALANGILKISSHGSNTTKLILIFQEHAGFSKLAFQQFQRCAAERNIELNDQILQHAEREVAKYPQITMGEFFNGYANKSMSDSLRRY